MAKKSYVKKSKTYWIGDFETTGYKQYVQDGYTRVFLYYIENRDDTQNSLGVSIDQFIEYLKISTKPNEKKIVYFHNLKFDFQFILHYLFNSGYILTSGKRLKTGQFTILMNAHKTIYSSKVKFSDKLEVEFRDSLLILQSAVANLPTNLEGGKLDFDYNKIRKETSIDQFTPDEIKYVKRDVHIVKNVLFNLKDLIGDKLTVGGIAFHYWKEGFIKKFGKKSYLMCFPYLEKTTDQELRKAYQGGYVYLNPKYTGMIIDKPIYSYDVNSLFPSVMKDKPFPYGRPIKVSNKRELEFYRKHNFDLAVFKINIVKATIKKGYVPFITNRSSFSTRNNYFKKMENTELWVTNVDYDLMCKYYDMDCDIDFDCYWVFRSKKGMFDHHIDHFGEIKMARENDFLVLLAKLMLNSLYGKFGSRLDIINKIPFLDGKEINYNETIEWIESKYYLPIAIFTTAYARSVTINAIQENKDTFVYADTDSMHLLDEAKGIKLDDKLFGYWKYEGLSKRSIFLKNKQYIMLRNGKIYRKIASLNKSSHHLIDFENFKIGTKIKDGKIMRKEVQGGIVLKPTDFTFSDG